jgi:hypothetical protein
LDRFTRDIWARKVRKTSLASVAGAIVAAVALPGLPAAAGTSSLSTPASSTPASSTSTATAPGGSYQPPPNLPVNSCQDSSLPRSYGTNFPVPDDPYGFAAGRARLLAVSRQRARAVGSAPEIAAAFVPFQQSGIALWPMRPISDFHKARPGTACGRETAR